MENQEKKNVFKTHFTAHRVAYMAIFVALSFVVSLLDFPIFAAAPMLKLDFGNVFIMLAGFLLGPVEGILVCIVKEAIHIPVGTTGGVGELANIILTTLYILIPSIGYRFKKGLKWVIPFLLLGILFNTAMSIPVGRFITFPAYGDKDGAFFMSIIQFVIFFNLIKGAAIAVGTCLLYKATSTVFKRTAQRFEKQ